MITEYNALTSIYVLTRLRHVVLLFCEHCT